MTSFPAHARCATHVKRRMRPTRSPSNGSPTLAMGYPSHRSGLANLQRDNRRRRRWGPRPSKWGHRAPDGRPTRREDNSGTNAAKPVRRSIGASGRVLDASHRPNRWALDTSPDPATRPGPPIEAVSASAPANINPRMRI